MTIDDHEDDEPEGRGTAVLRLIFTGHSWAAADGFRSGILYLFDTDDGDLFYYRHSDGRFEVYAVVDEYKEEGDSYGPDDVEVDLDNDPAFVEDLDELKQYAPLQNDTGV